MTKIEVESIFLNEVSEVDILMLYLSENIDYSELLGKFFDDVFMGEGTAKK